VGCKTVRSFDIGEIDDVIHGRLRLGVMAYLSSALCAEFNELKAKLGTTDGNLSVHLRKLEEAGYVAIEKTFARRKPLTRVRLTEKGRAAFIDYLDAISKLTEGVLQKRKA
jgi:DNA-binding MarR family transcriptional regulator